MTVPSTTRRAGPYLGNGVTTSFPFTFKVFARTDIAFTLTNASGISTSLVLDSDYSVTLNVDQDSSPGGTITYPISGSPMATGYTLVGVGALPYDQQTSFPDGGAYRASTTEDTFDRTEFQIQQLAEAQGRALMLPAAAAGADTQLPVPVPNKVIGWDSAAQALVNYAPSDLATVVVAGTSYFQAINGDGTTKVFTLTADPGNVNALDIAVNGVPQKNGIDFTVSGTVLTFVDAPSTGTQNIAIRYVAAVPVGSADAQDVTFLQAGVGAVPRSSQDKLREMTVSPKDFGAVGGGVVNDTVKLQAAIDALQPGQTLRVDDTHKITSSLVVTNKSRIRITGTGVIFLSGAPSNAYIFQLVGTIDDLEIDSLTLIGDNVSTNAQVAVGCNSGQTVSNTSFHDLKISNINVGISHNANLSGSWTRGLCFNNYLKNICGTTPGAGYGIQAARATDLHIYNNTIDNASRHSIYVGRGQNLNCVIHNNSIINHRSTVYDGSPRCAIDCGRVSGVVISNNVFRNCFDGHIYLGADTGLGDNNSDILITGNKFGTPGNVVPSIWLGEQLVPTTVKMSRIDILGNTFEQDCAVTAATVIYLLAGTQINVQGNRLWAYNVGASLPIFVEMGSSTYATSDSHIADVTVANNSASSDKGSVVTGSRLAYVSTKLCNGTSAYTIKDNVANTWESLFAFQVTPTNLNSRLKFRTTVTHDFSSIAANSGTYTSKTVNGVKPTSSITGNCQSWNIAGGNNVVFTYYPIDNSTNNVVIQANNATASAYDPPSQTFVLNIEDY